MVQAVLIANVLPIPVAIALIALAWVILNQVPYTLFRLVGGRLFTDNPQQPAWGCCPPRRASTLQGRRTSTACCMHPGLMVLQLLLWGSGLAGLLLAVVYTMPDPAFQLDGTGVLELVMGFILMAST